LREYQVNSKHSREFAAAEIATPPQVLGEIDLTQDSPASFAFTAALTAPQGYRFDGIAGWFECELAEGVWMTNSPLAAPRIARHQIFLAARDPFAVRPGEAVEVALRCRKEGDVIGWTIQPPGGAPRQKLSTFNAMALDKRALAPAGFGPLALNATGQARSAVLALADGTRTAAEIEAEVLAAHPALFPSEAQIRQFVRAELGQSTAPC
jgi:type I protein arginine methyltransferase